jgi:hypothetical protein
MIGTLAAHLWQSTLFAGAVFAGSSIDHLHNLPASQ